jgi:hypothetical protein
VSAGICQARGAKGRGPKTISACSRHVPVEGRRRPDLAGLARSQQERPRTAFPLVPGPFLLACGGCRIRTCEGSRRIYRRHRRDIGCRALRGLSAEDCREDRGYGCQQRRDRGQVSEQCYMSTPRPTGFLRLRVSCIRRYSHRNSLGLMTKATGARRHPVAAGCRSVCATRRLAS